jgi:hypothetical protein
MFFEFFDIPTLETKRDMQKIQRKTLGMFFYFSVTKSILCIKLKTVPQSSILYHCFSDY